MYVVFFIWCIWDDLISVWTFFFFFKLKTWLIDAHGVSFKGKQVPVHSSERCISMTYFPSEAILSLSLSALKVSVSMC